MVNLTEVSAIVIVALILVGIPVGSSVYESWLQLEREAAQPKVITIFAWTPEHGGWKPNEIVLRKGVPVKIVVIARDTAHSLVIPDLGIDTGPISPGHEALVEFTPEKTGTFVFYCGTVCSTIHHFMRGQIVVVEE